MFPRSLRLSRTGFEKSRGLPRTATPHFSISYGTLLNEAGFGVIVPKKAVKGAVARHQLKRRVREVSRLFARNAPADAVIVISARSGADTLTFAQIKDELSAAFKAILPGTTPPFS